MNYILVGLGNPGQEYEKTRHNTGRMVLSGVVSKYDHEQFSFDKKSNAYVSKGKIGKDGVTSVLPEGYMNKSGKSVATFVTSAKKAERLIVLYDDIDLPLGKIRIAKNRGSGGHNGVESIARSVKTKNFIRIRIGVSPATPGGKIKKPKGEKAVLDYLMGNFKPSELKKISALEKTVADAIEMIIKEGLPKAMNKYN